MRQIIGMMVALSIILLLYQWTMFVQSDENNRSVDQLINIDITENKDTLFVDVHYNMTLKKGTYNLQIPKDVDSLNCSDEEICFIDDQLHILKDTNTIKYTYELPKKEAEIEVYSDWLVKLLAEGNRQIHLTISGFNDDDSFWVTMKDPTYIENLSNITYYEWKFDNHSSVPLVKLPNEYSVSEAYNKIKIYSQKPIQIQDESIFHRFNNDEHIIIVSPKGTPLRHHYVTVIQQFDEKQLEVSLFISHLQNYSVVNEQNAHLLNVLAAYFYGIGKHDHDALETILEHSLNNQMKENWHTKLLQWKNDEVLLEEMLDQTLTESLGIKSQLFSNDINENQSLTPLYKYDNRKIYLNGELVESNWKGIIFRGDHYLPIAGLANLVGLNLIGLNDGNEILIDYQSNRYRFFLNDSIFIVNEDYYHTREYALFKIDGEVYILSDLVSEIFPFELSLTNEAIKINTQ